MIRTVLFLLVMDLLAPKMSAFAENLDAATSSAMQQTQNTLSSPESRAQYIKSHPDAAKADDKVNQLTSNPAEQQKIYESSSDIFGSMVKNTNGDPKKLQELADKAAGNPEEFLKSLTPEQQAQIRGIASDIEKSQPPVPGKN